MCDGCPESEVAERGDLSSAEAFRSCEAEDSLRFKRSCKLFKRYWCYPIPWSTHRIHPLSMGVASLRATQNTWPWSTRLEGNEQY